MMVDTIERVLTLQDRCDYCGAAGKIVVTFLTGELIFCGHNGREMITNLRAKSTSIHDPEGELTLV